MKKELVIDCGDVFLRPFKLDDAEAIYRVTAQPEVYEFLPDWRSTKEQRIKWFKSDEIPDNNAF